jgi:hypothetical protein
MRIPSKTLFQQTRPCFGAKYESIKIKEIIKNESILIPDESECEVSSEKLKLEEISNDDTLKTDVDSYKGHFYSPTRMSYRDR